MVKFYHVVRSVPYFEESGFISVSGKTEVGKINWIIVVLAMLLPLAGFIIHVLRSRHDYKCNIKEYEDIDRENDLKKKRELIDNLYKNDEMVNNLFEEASLFIRKKYLLNKINDKQRPREYWISIVSAVFGAFINSFMDGKLLGEDIIGLGVFAKNLALGFYIFAMFSFSLFLLVKFVENTEDDKNQIMKYELAYIDDILDDHIDGSHKEEIQYIVDVDGKTSHVTLREV